MVATVLSPVVLASMEPTVLIVRPSPAPMATPEVLDMVRRPSDETSRVPGLETTRSAAQVFNMGHGHGHG